jgi:ATP-dependent helicase HrpB
VILEPNIFPIDEQLETITESLKKNSCLLLKAETGAGKTTRLPPYLVTKTSGNILVLEPRRLAAKLSAERCAQILGTPVGNIVGHHIRFDKITSSDTRLLFITEGLFLSYLREDPTLSKYSTIILDEFHERSIHTDTALCLIRKLQATTRPDLKLIVMSATLDTAQLEYYLAGAKLFNIPGRVFPIEIENHQIETQEAILDMLHDPRCPKNILVFLPGMGAIKKLQDQLKGLVPEDVEIIPLHSTLNKKDQNKAFTGLKRKIILSTNIAETSLTIPNITGVVDTGTERRASFAPWSGMPLLQLEKISKASATQRAGRAGRVQNGLVFRTYPLNDFSLRSEFTPPEITRVELSHYMLDLIDLGHNPEELNWFELPQEKNLDKALELLNILGALKEGKITQLGKYLAKLPLHPRLGAMLFKSKDTNNFSDTLLAVCILSEGMILSKQAKFYPGDEEEFCDISLQSNLLKAYFWKLDSLSDYQSHLSDMRAYKRVIELYQSLSKRLGLIREPSKIKTTFSDISSALLAGYPDRIAAKRKIENKKGSKKIKSQDSYNFCMGRGGKLTANSALSTSLPDFIIVLDALENPKANAAIGTSITTASKITAKELEKTNSTFLTTSNESIFNEKKGTLTLSSHRKYGNINIGTTTHPPVIPQGEVLARLMHSNWPWPFEDDLVFQEYNKRVHLLNQANIEHNCPEFVGEMFELFIDASIETETGYQDLQKHGLKKLINDQLSPQDKYVLDIETPLKVTLSNGKTFNIEYLEEIPFIQARVQDLFGIHEHPSIANNKIPLLFKLLSPANKVIQNANNLVSLWGPSWELLRSDLRPRYPRHYWPDDPANSKPIRMKRHVEQD